MEIDPGSGYWCYVLKAIEWEDFVKAKSDFVVSEVFSPVQAGDAIFIYLSGKGFVMIAKAAKNIENCEVTVFEVEEYHKFMVELSQTISFEKPVGLKNCPVFTPENGYSSSGAFRRRVLTGKMVQLIKIDEFCGPKLLEKILEVGTPPPPKPAKRRAPKKLLKTEKPEKAPIADQPKKKEKPAKLPVVKPKKPKKANKKAQKEALIEEESDEEIELVAHVPVMAMLKDETKKLPEDVAGFLKQLRLNRFEVNNNDDDQIYPFLKKTYVELGDPETDDDFAPALEAYQSAEVYEWKAKKKPAVKLFPIVEDDDAIYDRSALLLWAT